mmetsp:Transcript_22310/g.28549  ORF Transcript_22310/g.28549 Transcript_22310/m.28549 type:complete len:140 (+) Transcript_22310:1517-1936(+)
MPPIDCPASEYIVKQETSETAHEFQKQHQNDWSAKLLCGKEVSIQREDGDKWYRAQVLSHQELNNVSMCTVVYSYDQRREKLSFRESGVAFTLMPAIRKFKWQLVLPRKNKLPFKSKKEKSPLKTKAYPKKPSIFSKTF